MRPLFDMHIHTAYCGHADEMTIPAILHRADELELDVIAITEHIFSQHELKLVDCIRRQILETKHRCRVIVGIEVDCNGLYTDGRLVAEDFAIADYVIGAIHYIPSVGIYPKSPLDCPFEPHEMLKYWRSTLLGVLGNPKIDTLAHPGRIIGIALELDTVFDDMLAIFEEAAEVSERNNIAWEINELTGQKIPDNFRQRWHETIQAAIDAGVEITYGSDAHRLEDIGSDDFSQSILSKLSDPDSMRIPACTGV